jgi:hypothetical protein
VAREPASWSNSHGVAIRADIERAIEPLPRMCLRRAVGHVSAFDRIDVVAGGLEVVSGVCERVAHERTLNVSASPVARADVLGCHAREYSVSIYGMQQETGSNCEIGVNS